MRQSERQSLEAHLKELPPDQEYKRKNVMALYFAGKNLCDSSVFAIDTPKKYSRVIQLTNEHGQAFSARLELDIREVTHSDSREEDYQDLRFVLTVSDPQGSLAEQEWLARYRYSHERGRQIIELSSGIQTAKEGLGLGTGLVSLGPLVVEAVIATQPAFFSRVPEVNAIIIDSAHAHTKGKSREGWTSIHALANGFRPLGQGMFERTYPTHKVMRE